MLDSLLTLGQAAAAVFLLYGGFLVLQTFMPWQRKPRTAEEQKDEMLLLRFML